MSSKRKRKKTIRKIKNRKEAEEAINLIVAEMRKKEKIELDLNQELNRLKAKAARRSNNIKAKISKLTNKIYDFVEENREELAGKSKSIKFANGIVRWRTSPPAVTITGEEEKIAKILECEGLNGLVKTKKTVKKREVLNNIPLIAGIPGIEISQRELFSIFPAKIETSFDKELRVIVSGEERGG